MEPPENLMITYLYGIQIEQVNITEEVLSGAP